MEGSTWKRVLLAWINSSEILKRDFLNIEQTDIFKFFNKLKVKMQSFPSRQVDLVLFLKEQYPAIYFHCDDENKLSVADYMYVYSLLLHFTCVKYPDEYFQRSCENLHEIYQEAIASFFQRILNTKTLDKTVLRNIIELSAPKKSLPAVLTKDSPTRLQKFVVSPPTPKTFMLDEKTKELHTIKALLETEKYEKACLETALKQNEEQTKKLVKQQQKFLLEISELKGSISKKIKKDPPNDELSIEQTKKDQKIINDKEKQLQYLSENFDSILEEKQSLEEKQKEADKQVVLFIDKISDLEIKLSDVQLELKKKEVKIDELTASKTDLEKHINEMRSPFYKGSHSIDYMNSSVECLDNSFSRTPNSSGSLDVPENLGCSVIDIQLREKEIENETLRNHNDKIKFENKRLTQHVFSLLKKNSVIFEFDETNLVADKDDNLTEIFMIFENYMQKLIQQYCNSNNTIQRLKDERNSFTNHIAEMKAKINYLSKQIIEFDESVNNLKIQKREIEIENEKFKTELENFGIKYIEMTNENIKINSQLDKLILSNENLINENGKLNEANEAEITKHIQEIEILNEAFSNDINKLNNDVEKLRDSSAALVTAREQLNNEKSILDNEILELKEIIKKCQKSDEKYSKENINLLKTRDQHIAVINELKLDLINFEKILLSKENDSIKYNEIIAQQNDENSKICFEIENVFKKNLELESEKENLKENIQSLEIIENNLKEEKSNLAIEIITLEQKLTENKSAKDKLDEIFSAQSETLTKLSEKFFSAEKDIQFQKYENKNLTTKLNDQIFNNEKLKSEIELLFANKEQYEKDMKCEFDTLKESISNYLETISNMEKYFEELKSKKEILESNQLDLFDELKSLKDKLNFNSEEKELLKNENKELNENYYKLSEENENLNVKYEQVLIQTKHFELKLSEKYQECLDLNIKLDEHNNDYEKLENYMQMIKKENEQLNNEHNELRNDLEEKMLENTKCNEEILNFKNDLKNLIEENSQLNKKHLNDKENIDLLNNKVDDLEIKNKNLESDLDDLSNIVETFTNDKLANELNAVQLNDKLEEKTKLLNETIENNENNLNKIINLIDLNITNSTKSESNSMLEKLEKTVNNLIISNAQSNEKNVQFEDDIKHLKEELNEKTIKHKELINELQKTLNDTTTCFDQVNEKCDQYKNEYSLLNEKNVNLQNQIDKIESEMKIIVEERNTLDIKYHELTKTNHQYNLKISSYENDEEKHNLEIIQLETKLKSANDQYEHYIFEKTKFDNDFLLLKYECNLNYEKFISKEKECDLINNDLKATSLIIAKLEESLSQSIKSLEEMNDLYGKYQDLKETEISLSIKNNELYKEIVEAKSTNALERSENKHKVDQLEELIAIIKQQISNTNDELKCLRKEKAFYVQENMKLNEILELEIQRNNENDKIIQENNFNKINLQEKIFKLENELEFLIKASDDKENEFNAVERKLTNLNVEFEKLNLCQHKAEENAVHLNRRLEKNSIRLGEHQAKNAKLEKENELMKSTLENNKTNLEHLQKEHTNIQNELKIVKSKLSKTKSSNESSNAKLDKLEETNKLLKVELDKVLGDELTARECILKLKKVRKDDEEKIKKLTANVKELSETKQESEYLDKKNVQLKLEIGSLNQKIEDLKNSSIIEIDKFTENLNNIQNENSKLHEHNEHLQIQIECSTDENTKLIDEISTTSLQIQILKNDRNIIEVECNQLKFNNNQLQIEKDNLEKDSTALQAKIKNLELNQNEIIENQNKEQNKFMLKLEKNETILKEKLLNIENLTKEIESIKLNEKTITNNLIRKTEEFENLKQLFADEKETTEKLKLDTSIFQAKLTKHRSLSEENEKKWQEERSILIANNKTVDERIKENRLEMEGKLEKMKTKMKTLYNEEITKMKSKHEREIFDYQAEIQVLRGQNDKNEIHVKKLSQRVLMLNEKICEYERDNKFMELKLKEFDSFKTTSLRKQQQTLQNNFYNQHHHHPNQHQQQNSQKQPNSSNLRMEDEEGEIFNNTYLADLKAERMSDFGCRDSLSVKELQHRNSMALPHLRSTYLAQYKDHNLAEEDIKYGIPPINLDDSLSSLLNTGQRKKVAGTTSYKRPGPPTPSKTAGRLSFGGTNELHSTILKESQENDVSTTKKTPAKFKLFSSRKPTDEQLHHHSVRRISIRRKSLNLSIKDAPSTEQGFTSTPRKSKLHFDQRRQLDNLLDRTCSDSQTDNEKLAELKRISKIGINNLNSKQYNDENDKLPKFSKWRKTQVIYSTESGTSDANSPCLNEQTTKPILKQKKKTERRYSIYHHGKMAKCKFRNSKAIRDQAKSKAKLERYLNFNKYRNSLNEIKLRKSLLNQPDSKSIKIENDIFATDNHNQSLSQIFGKELIKNNNDEIFEDDEFINTDEIQFEKLVRIKKSKAPFEITEIKCISSESNISIASQPSNLTSNSRTLYATSVIFNRKIPHVTKIEALRTSSIYIKNCNESVILVTNQSITLIDLIKMWKQMNYPVKIFLLISIFISIGIIVYLLKLITFP